MVDPAPRTLVRAAACVALLLLTPMDGALAQATDWVYWGRQGELGRVRIDGSEQEVLVRGLARASALAVDEATGAVFVAEAGRGQVQKIETDGRRSVLGAGTQDIRSLDWHGGRLLVAGGDILRMEPNSGQQTVLVPATAKNRGMCDAAIADGSVFWTANGHERILRSSLGGSELDEEWAWASKPCASLAVYEGRLWALETDGRLWRPQASSSSVAPVVQVEASGEGHAGQLTFHHGVPLWVECRSAFSGPCRIQRLVAGETARTVRQTEARISALAVAGAYFYWIEDGAVWRQAEAGGSLEARGSSTVEPEVVVPAVSVAPVALAGDGRFLFRLDGSAGDRTLIRSRPDGSEAVVLQQGRPLSSLDLRAGRLFWTEQENQPSSGHFGGSTITRIYQAEADGTGKRELAAFGDALREFEAGADYLAWIRNLDVERFPLDGSKSVQVWKGGNADAMLATLRGDDRGDEPRYLALSEDWLFWSDGGKTIVRMAKDGSRRGDLIRGLDQVEGLAVDEGRLVWADGKSLEVADLDGTNRRRAFDGQEQIENLTLHGGKAYLSEMYEVGTSLETRLVAIDLKDGRRHVLLEGDAVMGPGFTLSRRDRELRIPVIMALAVDEQGLVWSEAASGRFLAADHDGSNVRVLPIRESRNVWTLTLADGLIYGADNSREFWRARRDGSQWGVLERIERGLRLDRIAIDAKTMFWVDHGEDSLGRRPLTARVAAEDSDLFLVMPKSRQAPRPAAPPEVLGTIAIDDDWLYTVDAIGGKVKRRRLGDDVSELWVEKLAVGYVKDLRFAQKHVVWIDFDGIYAAPRADPTARQKIMSGSDITTLAVVPDAAR